ncbi:MAG TPA: 50S ribosomal protein L15 [Bacteroidota bacterium]|nr:50S ribosomal protein L15 [Bacteroidota bacterium]
MSLGQLKYAPGSRKRVKRIGRGQGSGHGGTATRGHKGEGARSGTHYRPWFEGGQMPLIRRVPKRGFHSPFKTVYQVVNVGTLEKLAVDGKLSDGKVTPEILYRLGVVSSKSKPVKMLGDGDLKAKLEISVHSFSKSAAQKIEAAGGKTSIISPK